jgi:hypothetical protein
MKPLTTHFSRPAPEFSWAGFAFPKFAWTLPRGSKAKRIQDHKKPVCGPYYCAPKPNSVDGTSFYLESDFMPGLRWQWCDEVTSSIRHTGWYTTEYGDGDKIRGLVLRLPKGRGFLAGWSMGESMASGAEYTIYATEREAAVAADGIAEIMAEKEREYQAAEDARREAEEMAEIEAALEVA